MTCSHCGKPIHEYHSYFKHTYSTAPMYQYFHERCQGKWREEMDKAYMITDPKVRYLWDKNRGVTEHVPKMP